MKTTNGLNVFAHFNFNPQPYAAVLRHIDVTCCLERIFLVIVSFFQEQQFFSTEQIRAVWCSFLEHMCFMTFRIYVNRCGVLVCRLYFTFVCSPCKSSEVIGE